MRRHEYESPYNPAVTELSRALRYDDNIRPDTLDKITRVLEGVKHTDEMISQKDTELQSTKHILAQKEQVIVQKDSVINQKTVELQSTKQVLAQKDQVIAQKEQNLEQLKKNGGMGVREEFIYLLNKLSPEAYSADFSKWSDKLPMKKHVVNNDIQVMEKNIKIYKEELEKKEQEDIRKEFISSLHERYPNAYSANFEEWTDSLPMKKHVDDNNFYVMVKNTVTYKKEIEEINAKKLEDAKRLKEEEEARKEQLLNDQAQEIARVKEQLKLKELESQNKDQLLLAKEQEKQELLSQKELEKEEEVHNKSLVKNQVIGELQSELRIKEIEKAYELKLQALTKQLEFKEKEVEEARIISELKGQLLTLKALYGHDVSFAEEFSAIQFRAENSIENKDFDDIADLSRYISKLVEAEKENSVSLDISDLLANISPISPINSAQHPVAVVNNVNFDIDQMHVTHSVLLSGSVEISILEDGSI